MERLTEARRKELTQHNFLDYVANGNFDLVKDYVDMGIEVSEGTFLVAAGSGSLKVIKYLTAKYPSIAYETYYLIVCTAAKRRHYDIVNFINQFNNKYLKGYKYD